MLLFLAFGGKERKNRSIPLFLSDCPCYDTEQEYVAMVFLKMEREKACERIVRNDQR